MLERPIGNTYSSVAVSGLPKLDRFFPDCALALIELVARKEFEFDDLKKIWFGSTFEYQPPRSSEWLNANRVEFAGRLFTAGDVRGRAFEYLGRYYGMQVESETFVNFGRLLDDVHRTLSRGTPAVTMFDMSFLQPPERRNAALQPHMIAIAGWDSAAGTLRIVEQVRGELTISMSQYEESFQRFAESASNFYVLRCALKPGTASAPLNRDEVIANVRSAVANLRSNDSNLGLNALRQLTHDVKNALEVERKPFAIPGQWIFSHDRHALRAGLKYWREAAVAPERQLVELGDRLAEAFGTWFQIDMTIERAIYQADVERMREALALLEQVARTEANLADLLESIASREPA